VPLKITPNTLTKAYTEAGYFARNVRTIEVLVDRDTVASGDAAQGQPWQHYDLGHGWCSYSFFEQCPHRMACARCDFYTPKNSSKVQLIEAKTNLQRMLANIPLTEDERAAVDDGQAALDSLLTRLVDVPTPAGPTPRQIDLPANRHPATNHRRSTRQIRRSVIPQNPVHHGSSHPTNPYPRRDRPPDRSLDHPGRPQPPSWTWANGSAHSASSSATATQNSALPSTRCSCPKAST
jgi:hypothetical protein